MMGPPGQLMSPAVLTKSRALKCSSRASPTQGHDPAALWQQCLPTPPFHSHCSMTQLSWDPFKDGELPHVTSFPLKTSLSLAIDETGENAVTMNMLCIGRVAEIHSVKGPISPN